MVNFKEDEQLNMLNHSCAHLMAQAVKHLSPQAKFWVGPVVAEGFYYDLYLGDDVIRDEDIPAIEAEMKKIAKSGKKIIRKEIAKEEAMEMFHNDEYKMDLIDGLEDGHISCYEQGDFTDLCRGPHVDNSQELMNVSFKIHSNSMAYWRGDEKRDHLQRVYFYAFPNKDELKNHLNMIKEARERDHKKIGAELDMFMFSETAPGMPYWLPRGWEFYQTLLKYSREVQAQHVQRSWY